MVSHFLSAAVVALFLTVSSPSAGESRPKFDAAAGIGSETFRNERRPGRILVAGLEIGPASDAVPENCHGAADWQSKTSDWLSENPAVAFVRAGSKLLGLGIAAEAVDLFALCLRGCGGSEHDEQGESTTSPCR